MLVKILLKLKLLIFVFILSLPQLLLSQVEDYNDILVLINNKSQTWDSSEHFLAYFNGVHPVLFDLFYMDGRVLGKMEYSKTSSHLVLDGLVIESGVEIEAIDAKNEFLGLWKYNPNRKELVWINAQGTRSYNAIYSHKPKLFSNEYISYVEVKKGFRNKGYRQRVIWEKNQSNYSLVVLDKNKLLLRTELKNDFQEPSSFSSNNIISESPLLHIEFEKKGQVVVRKKEGVLRMKPTAKMSMFTQLELNYKELIQVSVPDLDEEVFNKTMKDVIHEYMYAEPCGNGIEDARFFWWNQKFVQTDMSYFDKEICSFQLHIINTCLGVDTVLYYNYDRKAERFISSKQLLGRLKRQLKKQKKYKDFIYNYSKELSLVIRKDGLELYKEYDLIKGAEGVFISWEKLGAIDIKNLLKSMD